jgi:hypothetical protein
MKAVCEIEGQRRHHDYAQDVKGLHHRRTLLGDRRSNPPLDGVPGPLFTENSPIVFEWRHRMGLTVWVLAMGICLRFLLPGSSLQMTLGQRRPSLITR